MRSNLRGFHAGCIITLMMLAMFSVAPPLQAQYRDWRDTLLPPIQPLYGIADTTYVIGAWVSSEPRDNSVENVVELWSFLDRFGVRVLKQPVHGSLGSGEHNQNLARIDLLHDSAGSHRLIVEDNPINHAGNGRELELYPFDHVQSPYWQWKFAWYDGGTARENPVEGMNGNLLEERVYSIDDDVIAGDTIAKHVSYNWKSEQVDRYQEGCRGDYTDDAYGTICQSVQNSALFNDPTLRTQYDGVREMTYYVTVKGHLFELGASNPTDSLFQINVVYEVPAGTPYRNSSDTVVTDMVNNREFIDTILYVRKQDLAPSIGESFDKIQEISFPITLDYCQDGTPGPLNPTQPSNGSKRFDLRVRWLGGEKVALRTVALRDSLGELVMGKTAASDTYRTQIMNTARRLMRGSTTAPDTGFRNTIIALYAAEEPRYMQVAGYRYLEQMMRDTFNLDGDSLPLFRAHIAHNYYEHFTDLTLEPALGVEQTLYGYTDNHTTRAPYWPDSTLQNYFSIPYYDVPQLSEHNGGKYHLPLLPIDETLGLKDGLDAVEDYETTIQRLKYGRHQVVPPPDSNGLGYFNYGNFHYLGNAARAARDGGRAITPVMSPNASIRFLPDTLDGDSVVQDIIVGHIPEAAELRTLANVATLCYGARGMYYWWLGGYTNFVNTPYIKDGDTLFWYSEPFDGLGPVGGYLDQDTLNTALNYPFISRLGIDPDSTHPRAVLDTFYIGHGVRSDEIKWLNREWLPRIGKEMLKRGLRWRDGYSIQHSVARPNTQDTFPGFQKRPLPADEIITGVESYNPRTGQKDSLWATYVEVGMYHTRIDTTFGVRKPLLDTNYVAVVNKRSFERPSDIDSTSARGRFLDSLAETRVIKLKFNLAHPDTSGWNYVRIREISPDLTPLPGTNIPRRALDSVLRADSAVTIVLGSGRGAVLEIRYLDPAELIQAGDLRFNNQRKLVWDGLRYHLTFHRDSGFGRVYYMRSVPIHSPSDSVGQIYWDPTSLVQVSDNVHLYNVFPSMTVRVKSGDTAVSIVWTRHGSDTLNQREVVFRALRFGSDSAKPAFSQIEHIAYHNGIDSTQWGTSTISSLSGGDLISWSDSLWGIQARMRVYGVGSNWWDSNQDTLGPIRTVFTMPGVWPPFVRFAMQFPSVPTMTHIGFGDSTCGIVAQVSTNIAGSLNDSHIFYTRLIHDTAVTGRLMNSNGPGGWVILSNSDLFNFHPSIDQTQDVWGKIQEGVTWESTTTGGFGFDNVWVNFSSLWTPTNGNDDSVYYRTHIGATQQWTHVKRRIDSVFTGQIPTLYPNTASLNRCYDWTSQYEPILFSIVYHRNDTTASQMWQDFLQYARDSVSGAFVWPLPQNYTYGGWYPNASANRVVRVAWQPDSMVINNTVVPPETTYVSLWILSEGIDRQPVRQSVIYQVPHLGVDTVLNTTKQFFAKSRPTGYMADGRSVAVRLNDTLWTGLNAMLHDVWIATDSLGQPLPMIVRDTSQFSTDSLEEAAELFRTETFQASDSVQIGFEASGWFRGIASVAEDARLHCYVELVDATSGDVMALLDTFMVSSSSERHYTESAPIVDLLSGTYFVRMRIEAENLPSIVPLPFSSVPVSETFSYVGNPPLSKVRVASATAKVQSRLSAQPNPFTNRAEIRFSIPERDYITLTVYDQRGREVSRLLEHKVIEAGRFAIEVDGSHWTAGTYLVELRVGRERVVEKLVVVR